MIFNYIIFVQLILYALDVTDGIIASLQEDPKDISNSNDDRPSLEVGNDRTKRCILTNFLSQLLGLGGGAGTGVPPINVGSTGVSGLGLASGSGLGLAGGSGFGLAGGSAIGFSRGSDLGIPPINVDGSGLGRANNFESGGGGRAMFFGERFRESSHRKKQWRGHRVEDAYDESGSGTD
ncbi:hypothetical protein DdX_16406 [Ditylenchus destructor]|uniref:Uncharacterized protein n=1 Tax=Ditylenchus destructor TaxID=166010 RepID=A0AAD4MT89_9BILA|nr:hypothetical protein DdX_16406 [Ditylenchus destructor]